jgi:threonine dehydrogenase-like Zn-dependent dehydrogenase
VNPPRNRKGENGNPSPSYRRARFLSQQARFAPLSHPTVPHGVDLNGEKLFYAHVHLHGGPAPVRRFLPELINLVWKGKIIPGKVFDLTLPLDQVAEGYRAMDERRAIKTLLRPTR